MGIKYNKDRAKNRFILVILDLSNNLATLTSKTLEKKDNEIIKHKATTVILVSYDPKKNEDYKQDLGYAVRIDKFAESSIDMYVRCFTKTSEWEEWLAVKERLAIGIKKIVENNKASFAFPSQSIYVEKK